MSLVSIIPAEASVRCTSTGRPRELRVGRDRLAVTAIESVRDETAAHPVTSGPRTIFVVRTGAWRMRLCFDHRERRWLVEALDPGAGDIPAAA
jgi:hypothetical protein